MNKTDLIERIAESEDLPKTTVKRVLDSFVRNVGDALSSGDEVKIPDLGGFSVQRRNARSGRNPKTGESIYIAAKNGVRFRVAKSLSESVN